MTAAPTGYSGTPLAKKLGIKDGSTVHVSGAPEGYAALLEPLPPGVTFLAALDGRAQLVHAFVTRASQLQQVLVRCRAVLAPDAALWISWPKKASKQPTDLTEDVVRDAALPLGFVDVKVCAVDAVWSGLKLVVRRELR
jgi:hypothetical protein